MCVCVSACVHILRMFQVLGISRLVIDTHLTCENALGLG